MESLNDIWAVVLENIKKTYSEVFVTLWLNDIRLEVLNDRYAVLVNNSDLKCKFLNDHVRLDASHAIVTNDSGMKNELLEQGLGFSIQRTPGPERIERYSVWPLHEPW